MGGAPAPSPADPLRPHLRVGTAGWTLPREEAAAFPGEGTHLQRYARVFSAVEVNSSFHRPHRPSTWERWAASVPDEFRFSVKVPKTITHGARLREIEQPLEAFLAEVRGLGAKLGCLLMQLPPSFAFDADLAGGFLAALRQRYAGDVACEPRHATWMHPDADRLLREHRVARVAADPARPAGAGQPAGWPHLHYFRLHGSPRMYYSSYTDPFLAEVAGRLAAARAEGAAAWCIFDNTAHGAATGDALRLLRMTEGWER
jgi:uncharacterized protein YecE (DUF72 family)